MCTEYRPHTHKAGDTYCEYAVVSKNPKNSDGYAIGDKICILCDSGQASCPEVHKFYRYPIMYDLGKSTSIICTNCSSTNYYEKGHDAGSKEKTVSKMTQIRKERRKKYQKQKQGRTNKK